MKWQDITKWTIVSALTIIFIGSITLNITLDNFSIMLNDGTMKAKYSEGNLKVYSGRNIAFNDYINIYYWNGEGYTTMYKARGKKYSNLSYYTEGDITFIKQQIQYSRGNLTRYFEISEYNIKESFEWQPNNKTLKVYFLWTYDNLDKFAEKKVYLDKNIKNNYALMDFDIVNNWNNEIDNIIRVERFQNGRLKIRTKVFKGDATFDPIIKLKPNLEVNNIFKRLKVNNMKEHNSIFTMYSPSKLDKNSLQFTFNEVCGRVLDYKVLFNDTCIKEVNIPVYKIKEVCSNINEIDNIAIEYECQNISTIIRYDKINESYTCMKEVTEIKNGEFDYEIKSNILMEHCEDGTYGYKIDWKPSLKNDILDYTQNDWAWWNISYDYKRDIVNQTVSDLGVSVNNTGGFCGNIIWTNPKDDNLSIYYNNCESYKIIINDTSVGNYDVETLEIIDYEGFTIDLGSWNQAPFATDDWRWRDSAPDDSSSTGPNELYDGPYVVTETSSGDCNSPDTSILYLSPAINFDNYGSINVNFAYNMIGSTMGTLHIKENSTGDWISIWNRTGDQGSSWLIDNAVITGKSGLGNVAIWMDCGASFTSDAAVDSVNVVGITSNNPTSVYSNDAVAVYHFGVNSSTQGDVTTDSTGNYDGDVNGATFTDSGKFGSAFEFVLANTDSITFDDTIIGTLTEGSISLWCKISDLTARNSIFSYTSNSSSNKFLHFSVLDTGVLTAVIRDTGSGQQINIKGTDTTILEDTWYHLIWTCDGSNWKLYINGENESFDVTTQTGDSSQSWFFNQISDTADTPALGGMLDLTPGNYVDGTIDEVRIYNRSLTALEIEELYNNSVIGRNLNFGSAVCKGEDTCTCPGDTTNHTIDCSDGCNITSCTAGHISYTGAGETLCNGTWDITGWDAPPDSCKLNIGSECHIT